MINQAIKTKLVKIYLLVCEKYKNELKYHCQRFTNNSTPRFTDQEIITIYLFCVGVEKRNKVKQMYEFIQNYLLEWFPNLPSYVAFNTRLNKLTHVFQLLLDTLIEEFRPIGVSTQISLLDSMPIVTSSGKRPGKVATEITDKSYCSTKNLFYHGVKLHALAFQSHGQLPHPESFIITEASKSDLKVFEEYWSSISFRTFLGDKAYINKEFFKTLYKEKKSEMLTPVKATKNEPLVLTQMEKAHNDLYSRAVSAVRQPIESLFNWIIEKTDIQRASTVRSTNGLKIHVFGKLAAAFIKLAF